MNHNGLLARLLPHHRDLLQNVPNAQLNPQEIATGQIQLGKLPDAVQNRVVTATAPLAPVSVSVPEQEYEFIVNPTTHAKNVLKRLLLGPSFGLFGQPDIISDIIDRLPNSGFIFLHLQLFIIAKNDNFVLVDDIAPSYSTSRVRNILLYTFHGRTGIIEEIKQMLARFDIYKAASETRTGSDENRTLYLVGLRCTALVGQQGVGGTTCDESDYSELVTKPACLMDVPWNKRFYKGPNGCLMNALKVLVEKDIVSWPRNRDYNTFLMNKFGLRDDQKIAVEKALSICTFFGLQVDVTVYDISGNVVNHCSNMTLEKPKAIGIKLGLFNEHYWLIATPSPPTIQDVPEKIMVHCEICGERMAADKLSGHSEEHNFQINRTKKLLGEIRSAFPSVLTKKTDESFNDFSQRYLSYYKSKALEYLERFNPCDRADEALWFCGPGGTGKTVVLKHIEDIVFKPQGKIILKLAVSAKVASEMEGYTIASFLYRSVGSDQINTWAAVHLEEISMISERHLMDVDHRLRELRKQERMFGNLPIFITGDFLQLPPVSGHKAFVHPLFRSVTPLPLTFPFRYTQASPLFFPWLLSVRHGIFPPFEMFSQLQFKFITPKEWVSIPNENKPRVVGCRWKLLNQYNRLAMECVPLEERIILPIQYGKEEGTQVLTHNAFPKTLRMKGSTEGDGDLLVLNYLYRGQRLMVTQNQCVYSSASVSSQNEECCNNDAQLSQLSQLYNGDLCFFVGINDNDELVVEDDKGVQYKVSRTYRVCEGYFLRSFALQTVFSSTGHKTQGETLDSLALDVTDHFNDAAHLFYACVSRCANDSQVYFIVPEMSRQDYFAYDKPLAPVIKKRRQKLCFQYLDCGAVIVSPACVEIMKSSLKPSFNIVDNYTCPDGIQYYEQLEASRASETRFWTPQIPAPFLMANTEGDRQEHPDLKAELQHVLDFNLIFDVETGAADGYTNHPDYFDDNGQYIGSFGNKSFLLQEWWMSAVLPVMHGAILWCCDYPCLQPFYKYQLSSGIIIFHKGYFETDGSKDKSEWCKEILASFIFELIQMKAERILSSRKRQHTENGERRLRMSVRESMPWRISGFNIDSFDIQGYLQTFMKRKEWLGQNLHLDLVPNVGASFTMFSISKTVPLSAKKTETFKLLEMHDVKRCLGPSSLAGYYEAFVKGYINKPDEWHHLLEEQMGITCSHLLSLINYGLQQGKTYFPHFHTQCHGAPSAVLDQEINFPLHAFPQREHAELIKHPEKRKLNLRTASREYMRQDLATTLCLYIAYNKLAVEQLGFSIMRVNTMQQFTTYAYLKHSLANQSPILNLNTSNAPSWQNKNKRQGYDIIPTRLPLSSASQKVHFEKAMFGGKVLPRIRSWASEDPENDFYMYGDISGMYASVQENYDLPYGEVFERPGDLETQTLVRDVWNTAKRLNNPMILACPHQHKDKVRFHWQFLATVTLDYPDLILEPGVSFKVPDNESGYYKNLKGRTIHGLSLDGEPRTQTLTCVDIATAMADGADLIEVFDVTFWECSGPINSEYIKMLSAKKSQAEAEGNKGVRELSKLSSNAYYGACLKSDKNSKTIIVDPGDPSDFERQWKSVDTDNAIPFFNDNGTIRISGHAATMPPYSSRSQILGVFILAWSHFMLQRALRIGFGKTFNPSTKSQMKEALFSQPLYGDTDSVVVHKSHLERWIAYDSCVSPQDQILHYGDSTIPKSGKFLDELTRKKDCDEDFKKNKFVKVIKFASNAPKSYTAACLCPNGEKIFKSKCKGIPYNADIVLVPNKKNGELEIDIIDIDDHLVESTKFICSSEDVHNRMFYAISSPDVALSSLAIQRIKKHGINVKNKFSHRTDGASVPLDPLAMGTTDLKRELCSDGEILNWPGRRMLSKQEALFLELSEKDWKRLLVPIGWNEKGSLFSLP